ncbi:MAG: hypothetical protein ACRDL5_05765, partial [Solirubrobacteraceae bacterium]
AGQPGISARQLRARAEPACLTAAVALARIASPALPDDTGSFLVHGIAVIEPEVGALSGLRPHGSLGASYRTALDASRDELAALQAAVRRIDDNADPIATVQALQSRLASLETRARAAWSQLGLSDCADS